MKNDTMSSARSLASASLARPAALWLTLLSSLALVAPNASAVVTVTPTQLGACELISGTWFWDGGEGADFDSVGDTRFELDGLGGVLNISVWSINDKGGTQTHTFPMDYGAGLGGPRSGSFDAGVLWTVSAKRNGEGDWNGTYSFTNPNCDDGHGVPDGGHTAGMLAMGTAGLCAVRRLKSKKRGA